MSLSRRQLIRALACSPLALSAALRAAGGDRRLILIELQGGNDGLNTVVPVDNPRYRRARPRLALAGDRCAPIAPGLGLHPRWGGLMPLWRAGEMAIAQGLGYEQPNRSHFRSTDIWASASDALQLKRSGWLADALSSRFGPEELAAVVFGGRDAAFREGSLNTLKLRRLRELDTRLPAAALPGDGEAVRLINRVRRLTADFQQRLRRAEVAQLPGYPTGKLGRQAGEAMALIRAGLAPQIIQLHHNGYDTHSEQIERQAALLGELADTVRALRRDLVAAGCWHDTLIVTVSEFGRRVAENGSAGTDHGTAAPQFVFGGRVNGGLHGAAPSLAELQNGDLVHTVDFRSLYASVLQDWLSLDGALINGRRFAALDLIRRG